MFCNNSHVAVGIKSVQFSYYKNYFSKMRKNTASNYKYSVAFYSCFIILLIFAVLFCIQEKQAKYELFGMYTKVKVGVSKKRTESASQTIILTICVLST